LDSLHIIQIASTIHSVLFSSSFKSANSLYCLTVMSARESGTVIFIFWEDWEDWESLRVYGFCTGIVRVYVKRACSLLVMLIGEFIHDM
jgi:hypothetical protein